MQNKQVPVRFKQVAVFGERILALDEKGFLWATKGTVEDPIWEKMRHPKITVAHQPTSSQIGGKPLTQKIDLSDVEV